MEREQNEPGYLAKIPDLYKTEEDKELVNFILNQRHPFSYREITEGMNEKGLNIPERKVMRFIRALFYRKLLDKLQYAPAGPPYVRGRPTTYFIVVPASFTTRDN